MLPNSLIQWLRVTYNIIKSKKKVNVKQLKLGELNRKAKNQADGQPGMGIFSTPSATPNVAGLCQGSRPSGRAKCSGTSVRPGVRVGATAEKAFVLDPTNQNSLADGIQNRSLPLEGVRRVSPIG